MKMQCDRDTLTQTHIKIFNIYMSSFERYSIFIYTIENRERWRYWTQCNRDTQSHTQAKQNAFKIEIWSKLLGIVNLQMIDTLLNTIQLTDKIYRRDLQAHLFPLYFPEARPYSLLFFFFLCLFVWSFEPASCSSWSVGIVWRRVQCGHDRQRGRSSPNNIRY